MNRDGDRLVRTSEAQATVGIFDCLSAGFEKINGMLWVVLLPMALGLFLWRGPQLSVAPAITNLLKWYFSIVPAEMLDAQSGTGIMAGGSQLTEALQGIAGDVNVFSFLTMGLGIAGRGAIPAAQIGEATALFALPAIERPVVALGTVFALQGLGLFLGACFLGLIAQRVRGEAISLWRLARRVVGYWLSIVGFVLMLAIAALCVSMPIAVLLGLAFAMAPGAAEVIFMAVIAGWQAAALWLALFTFFVVDAAIVGELGPLRAARSSMRLVARNFWSATGFVILYLVIAYGMLALWGRLDGEPWSVLLGIVGNGYVASGLAASSMVYYRAHVATA